MKYQKLRVNRSSSRYLMQIHIIAELSQQGKFDRVGYLFTDGFRERETGSATAPVQLISQDCEIPLFG